MPTRPSSEMHAAAGDLRGLHSASQKSNQVLADMDNRAKWLHSYVTGDKLYCVYIADNEDAVREHATTGGFPADAVNLVSATIDPTTGE